MFVCCAFSIFWSVINMSMCVSVYERVRGWDFCIELKLWSIRFSKDNVFECVCVCVSIEKYWNDLKPFPFRPLIHNQRIIIQSCPRGDRLQISIFFRTLIFRIWKAELSASYICVKVKSYHIWRTRKTCFFCNCIKCLW